LKREETIMRVLLAGLGLAATVSMPGAASADSYRYCAVYNVDGGATNCYFVTWQQCQAAISGMGGFCEPNPFYSGEPASHRRARARS
jgi:hypothetical protein